MINFTKQEIEYFSLQTHVKIYQEYLTLLQDGTARYLSMLNFMYKGE